MMRVRSTWLPRIGGLLLAAGLCLAGGIAQASSSAQQDMIKAAFVLNIAKFVSWPEPLTEARGNQLTLCYYREDVLGKGYDIIHQRSVNGRRLQRRQVQQAAELTRCDMLLLSEQQLHAGATPPLVTADTPLLTIVDLTGREPLGYAYPGVHVALVRQGTRIGLEVNLSAATNAGLKFSSRLLKLARIVDTERPLSEPGHTTDGEDQPL